MNDELKAAVMDGCALIPPTVTVPVSAVSPTQSTTG
jgi:hypothetical protein